MTQEIHATREEWLLTAIEEVRPLFDANGAKLPDAIRVTCGFPSTASRSGAIGQAWSSAASADKHWEILISPVLAEPARVMDVLIHELCHTVHGGSAMNHGKVFGSIAHRMGLAQGTKGWKNTIAGPTFAEMYGVIIDSLGAYPHAPLSMGQTKKQATRLLKAQCKCGYTIRLTAKWANTGLPTCVCGGAFKI